MIYNYISTATKAIIVVTSATAGGNPGAVAQAYDQQPQSEFAAEDTSAFIPLVSADHPQFELWPEASKRLAHLAALGEDHDGEGAAAPNLDSISIATLFVRQLPFYAPRPRVGLDGDGSAVVEFHDESEISQIIFRAGRLVEIFASKPDAAPVGFEGSLDDPSFPLSFLEAFGFRFAA